MKAALIAASALAAPAAAIDIRVTFDANASEVYMDDGDDLTLSLIPIFEAAAAHWEEIFLDPYTVQITYWWEDVPDPVASDIDDDGAGLITANIRIPTDASWWFDPTPFADTEFSPMQPYLFRDTPVSEQNEAFRNPASVPDVFEVSYVGEANLNDLLTIVMHEIGHVIGLNDAAGVPECDDDYYDIPLVFTNGSPVGLRISGTDCAHLALGGVPECLNCQALMWPSQNDNSRTRPGAADILSIASAAGWVDVKLPRTYYLEVVGDWTDDAHWLGGVRPDMSVDAYVVSAPPTALILNTANGAARNLVIDGDNDIFMGGYRLSVIDTMRMAGGGVSVNLNDVASELEVNTLLIEDGAQLVLNAGLVDSEEIDNDAFIFGAGTVDVGTSLENTGVLQGDSGTLWLTTANPGLVFDLDGFIDDPAAEIIATTGSIGIIGNFVDDFAGTTTVGDGRILAFTDELDFSGPVFLFGGATEALVSGPTRFGFGSVLTVDQTGRLLGDIDFSFSADVFVPQEGDVLILDGSTTYGGGEYVGAGEIRQVGDADFQADTTIGPLGLYDWDGSGASVTNIASGVTVTIDADRIEPGPFFDGFDGTLNMVGSTLFVNTSSPWGFCGDALVNVLGGADSTIGGATMFNQGFWNVDGTGTFLCEVDNQDQGELHLFDASAVAHLTHADNDMTGGLVSGDGTLDVNAKAGLFGWGTIEADVDCNGQVRADAGVITISGSILVPAGGFIGTEGPTGELNVTHTWTVQAGTLELKHGTVSGGNVIVAGTARGEGTANVPLLLNRGLLAPGATLLQPGDQTGILLLSTDFEQLPDAVLEIGVGGLAPGAGHDQIQVGQSSTLAGELHLGLVGGFVPNPGDEFVIMSHGSLAGTFAAVEGANIGNGLSFEVQYNPFDVRLVVVGTPCPGDLLPPMGVGIEDLLELLATWGQPNVPGDLLPPPGVGIEDLLELLANWGPCP